MNKAYNFEKRKDTEEIHIFKGSYENLVVTYKPTLISICGGKVHRSSEKIGLEVCLSEAEARHQAAHLGRSVCGTCVSSLYSSYENNK